jgi:ribosomal protein S18 acetylase RimI-like enzyme
MERRPMSGNLVIRSALEADFAPLCSLYCQSIRCNRDGFIQDLEFHGCLRAKTRDWRASGGDMMVALDEGKLVAMGALAPESESSVELCKLHVQQHCQGQGVGRAMSERLIALAQERGFGEVTLHVTTTQQAAIKLYHGIGFKQVKQAVFETTVFGAPVAFDTLYMSLPIAGAPTGAQQAG